MNERPEVMILSGVRTGIGKFGGGLATVPPCDLAAAVVRDAVARAGVEPADVGHAVFGNVIHTEATGHVPGPGGRHQRRAAGQHAGLTVNRLCGSGLQAIISAAQAIMLGDTDAAVAGGAESMSRGQYWLPDMRWGAGCRTPSPWTPWSARSPTRSITATWA